MARMRVPRIDLPAALLAASVVTAAGAGDAAAATFNVSKISSGVAQYGGGVAAVGMVNLHLDRSDVSHNTAWGAGGGVALSVLGSISPRSSYCRGPRCTIIPHGERAERCRRSVSGSSMSTARRSVPTGAMRPTRRRSTSKIPRICGPSTRRSSNIVGSGGSPVGTACSLGPGNTLYFDSNKIQDSSCGTLAAPNLGINALVTAACTHAPAGLLGCRVHPIRSTSHARNAGNPNYCTAGFNTSTDQRDYNRVGVCDAGSYENGGTP